MPVRHRRPDTTTANNPPTVRLSVLARRNTDWPNQILSFGTTELNFDDGIGLKDIQYFLQHRLETKEIDPTHTTILIIEGFAKGLDQELSRLFSRYPEYLADAVSCRHSYVRHPYATGESESMPQDLAFVLTFRRPGPARQDYAEGNGHNIVTDLERTRIGAWIPRADVKSDPLHTTFPRLIILLFESPKSDYAKAEFYARELETRYRQVKWYGEGYADPGEEQADPAAKAWQPRLARGEYNVFFIRLFREPVFVFYDLYKTFQDFDGIINHFIRRVARSEQRPHDVTHLVNNRVFKLHAEMNSVILVQKWISSYETTRKRLMDYSTEDRVTSVSEMCERLPGEAPNKRYGQREKLIEQLRDLDDEIAQYKEYAEMVCNEFQTMIDLEYSIVNSKLNNRMSMLTVMTFAMTPAALVAAIFGMSTFKGDAAMFGYWGPITIFLSILLWKLVDHWFTHVDKMKPGPWVTEQLTHLEPVPPHRHHAHHHVFYMHSVSPRRHQRARDRHARDAVSEGPRAA